MGRSILAGLRSRRAGVPVLRKRQCFGIMGMQGVCVMSWKRAAVRESSRCLSLEPIQEPRSARVSDPAETADRRSPLRFLDRLFTFLLVVAIAVAGLSAETPASACAPHRRYRSPRRSVRLDRGRQPLGGTPVCRRGKVARSDPGLRCGPSNRSPSRTPGTGSLWSDLRRSLAGQRPTPLLRKSRQPASTRRTGGRRDRRRTARARRLPGRHRAGDSGDGRRGST